MYSQRNRSSVRRTINWILIFVILLFICFVSYQKLHQKNTVNGNGNNIQTTPGKTETTLPLPNPPEMQHAT